MTKNIFYLFLLAAIFTLSNCQKERLTEKGFPEVETTEAKVLSDGGVTFKATILTDGGSKIFEHGFLWDQDENPGLGADGKVFLGECSKGSFTYTVTSCLKQGEEYHVRAFVQTEDYLSLGKVITFFDAKSRAPELLSITPSAGVCGDTLLISGKNFSENSSLNQIMFGNVKAKVLSSKKDELKVIVPLMYEIPVQVKVTVGGYQSINGFEFRVLGQTLNTFRPSRGTFYDIITLTGNNFCLDTSMVDVYFNNKKAQIVEWSRTYYRVLVPPGNNAGSSSISLKCLVEHKYDTQFLLDQAEIDNVNPVTTIVNNILYITGENFNPVKNMNKVKIGSKYAPVLSSSANMISVRVPNELKPGTYAISVETIYGFPVEWDVPIEIYTDWTKVADFPGLARTAAVGFTVDGKGYVGTGQLANGNRLSDFWCYDPETNSWTSIANFPVALTYATGFNLGEYGYVTLGKTTTANKTLRMFDPVSGLWTILADMPGAGSTTLQYPAFVINQKAYIVESSDLYEYTPSTDNWVKLNSVASAISGNSVAFEINGKGYFGIGWSSSTSSLINDFYEYNPSSDTWTKKASFPGESRHSATAFSLPNGKGYVGMGYNAKKSTYLNDMWEYDPLNDTWRLIENFPGTARSKAVAMIIGSAAYITTGLGVAYPTDVWRFAPRNDE